MQGLILFALDVLELGEDSLCLVKALAAQDKASFLEPAERAKPAQTVSTSSSILEGPRELREH